MTSQLPSTNSETNRISNNLKTAPNGIDAESKGDAAVADVASAKNTGSNGQTEKSGVQREINGEVSPVSSPKPSGVVLTRKRSRSGTRINRPLPEGNFGKRRGTNDPNGRLVEQVELRDYIDR